jgi:hypothetical protein
VLLLGSREDNAHLGYLEAICPRCGHRGLLGVYIGKRKVTFAALVALPVAEQLFLECLECGAKMGVSPAQELEVRQRMVSREQLAGLAAGAARLNESRQRAEGMRTAYQVLQVDTSAEPEVIQAAFKRLAFKYHPDRSTDPNAAARMRELIDAHDLLTDEQDRWEYDRSLGIVRPRPGPPPDAQRRPPAMRADDV